jgi:hypothetical protein
MEAVGVVLADNHASRNLHLEDGEIKRFRRVGFGGALQLGVAHWRDADDAVGNLNQLRIQRLRARLGQERHRRGPRREQCQAGDPEGAEQDDTKERVRQATHSFEGEAH